MNFTSKDKKKHNLKFVYLILHIGVLLFAILCLISIIIYNDFVLISKLFIILMLICEIPLAYKYWIKKKQ